MQHMWNYGGCPWGGLLPRAIHFRKLFSRAPFSSEITCLRLGVFRNYLASKLTILEKYSNIPHIWPFAGKWGLLGILENFSWATFASEIVCLYLEPLKITKLRDPQPCLILLNA